MSDGKNSSKPKYKVKAKKDYALTIEPPDRTTSVGQHQIPRMVYPVQAHSKNTAKQSVEPKK